MRTLAIIAITPLFLILAACANTPITANSSKSPEKSIPVQGDRSTINQLAKSDFDRMADVEIHENTESLRLLMLKLYKRNPHELQKSTSDVAEKMVNCLMAKPSIITSLSR